MTTSQSRPPQPSPISTLITTTTTSLPYSASTLLALPLEIHHNLRHQHAWTSLTLHYIPPTAATIYPLPLAPHFSPSFPPATSHFLISGLPPRHAYIHPDLQTRLLKEGLTQKDVAVQREWVVPVGLGQKPSLSWLAGVFDALPLRKGLVVGRKGGGDMGDHEEDEDEDEDDDVTEDGKSSLDAGSGAREASDNGYPNPKRVLLAMKAQDGLGGDGTVAYYVCLEGEVKPRQNG